ncbi:MAG: PD40 domain-containing protein, partial [Vicinamibacteria bacterium]|nr:PD40 domain-containing protein [Vicinamibacteria bacterium]
PLSGGASKIVVRGGYYGRYVPSGLTSPKSGERDLGHLLYMQQDTRGWKAGVPTTFLATPAFETFPMFSPDGRFVAYSSRETGVGEVYVRSFPGPGGTWRVSTGGGGYPTWSATSHELLFSSGDQIMVASYTVAGDVFEPGKPQPWSPVAYNPFVAQSGNPYALHPDGKRVAIAAAEGAPNIIQDKLVLITNFFDYLRKIASLKP